MLRKGLMPPTRLVKLTPVGLSWPAPPGGLLSNCPCPPTPPDPICPEPHDKFCFDSQVHFTQQFLWEIMPVIQLSKVLNKLLRGHFLSCCRSQSFACDWKVSPRFALQEPLAECRRTLSLSCVSPVKQNCSKNLRRAASTVRLENENNYGKYWFNFNWKSPGNSIISSGVSCISYASVRNTGDRTYDVSDKFVQPWCFIFSRDYLYSDMRAINLLEPDLW